MSVLVRILVAASTLAIAVLIQNYRHLARDSSLPQVQLNEYWGPGNGAEYKENPAIVPFDISVPPELISDLSEQLERPLKLPPPLEGVNFEYGFNSKQLQKVVDYWRTKYLPKWSEREQYLKQFPHFATEIQGLRIHFIHVKPTNADGKQVLPLILLHGWPGTVREFYDIIPLLTTPNEKSDFVFEVIAPSLPGYGWSEGASKQKMGPAQMAIIFRNLMLRLGHEKFFVQGGDWGSLIGANMATLFQSNVLGYHSNMCTSNHPLSVMRMVLTRARPSLFLSKNNADFYPALPDLLLHIITESGYLHLQATKPDTIGIALANTPIGLAAYILEKFSTWTNSNYRSLPDGGLTERYSMDALFDNVMIYYLTNSIATSQRLYYEAFSSAQRDLGLDQVHVHVPTGCARFKHDLVHATDAELKYKFKNLVHSAHYPDGGHFAAMELPQVLYNDFVQFVATVRKS